MHKQGCSKGVWGIGKANRCGGKGGRGQKGGEMGVSQSCLSQIQRHSLSHNMRLSYSLLKNTSTHHPPKVGSIVGGRIEDQRE